MSDNYSTGQVLDSVNFQKEGIEKGEFEDCSFVNCNLSETDLTEIKFVDCFFERCDLSMANILKTAFRGAQFAHCKLLGLHFENCNELLFSVNFQACHLNLSSFYKRSLKNTKFIDCSLQEVDFVEADLTGATFKNCDLDKALFDRTLLDGADFRSSYRYTIDPDSNRVKRAKFSSTGLAGLLQKYDIIIE